VWRARLGTSAVLGATSFAVAALFAFVNLYAVRQSVVSLVLPRRIANIEIGEEVPGRMLLLAVIALSLLVGGALFLPSDLWSEALLARIGRPFGETDPYFGADLGFFVYWLPVEMAVHLWAVLLLVVVALMVIVLYALTPSLRWEARHLYLSAYVRRHFVMLGGMLLLLLAWSYRLRMYSLLADGGGRGGSFTAVDHRVLVPAMLLLAVVTFCAALVVAWAGWSGQMRLAFLAVTTVLLLAVAGRSLAPLLARRAADPAAAEARERPYVATRLGYTRRAYGVDRIRPDSLGTGFASARQAASRVGVWDAANLAQAAQRLRRVRVVGEGEGVAWQSSPTSLQALLVERSSDSATGGRDVWGVGRYDAASADDRGFPVRINGGRLQEELVFDEPAVFTGAPDFTIVSDSGRRIVGVEMASTVSRLAHAWSLQNFRLLFGELPLDRPTILRRRDPRQRIAALAPFFAQGTEVIPVVAGDSLYWAIELYAASSTYPLSRRFTLLGEERGYLQHAGTALVHGASGGVRIVLVSSPDPVTSSWADRFPTLFVRATSLPPSLRAALPRIADGARAQALAFAAAGFRGDSFEVRHFGTLDGADSAASREPLHVELPGARVAALWPLLDDQERVRGVLAAEGGAERATAWIPLTSDGRRWGAVLDRLRIADSAVRENGVVRSPARVVPVGARPLYLQPVFQWRPGGSPRLLRVVTLSADTVRVGPTLAAAVGVGSVTAAPTPLRSDLRGRVDSLYRVMRDALSRGNWAAFGRAFDALGAAGRLPEP
jgi:uncharacterized membrane protein (UPF0182 family)